MFPDIAHLDLNVQRKEKLARIAVSWSLYFSFCLFGCFRGYRSLNLSFCCPNNPTKAEDDDCKSEFCWTFKCKEKLENGETCVQNDDCISGFCSVRSGLKCSDKLEEGDICVQDEDCASGDCDKFFCSSAFGPALTLVYSALLFVPLAMFF